MVPLFTLIVKEPSSPEMVPVLDFSTFTVTLASGWLSLIEMTLPVTVTKSFPAVVLAFCAMI